MAMTTRTPSPSSDSEGNASCVTLTTYYDCDNVDSEVESHFLRALQRAEGRSESGDEWQEEGASPTPSSDHCSTGMEDHSQARSSPPPSDSSRQLSAAEDTRSTVPSPTTAVTTAHPEPAATSSYRTDSSQVFLYPPPPYSHHRTTQATYPSMMVLPSHLLRAKMLQPHILQELMQPDVYAMDEDDLPNVPGQGKTGDILWPTHFVKGEPSRGGGSIYSSPHCNLIGQQVMMSSRGTVHYPPAHSIDVPTSSPAYSTFPVYAPPPTPMYPPPQPLQDMFTTNPGAAQVLPPSTSTVAPFVHCS